MVKMYQKRHEEKRNVFISRARNQNNSRRYMTKKYCRSKSNGVLQQKIWKPVELKMTKIKIISQQHNKMDDQLKNKVWDPDILKMEDYDQEVIFLSSWGV